MTEEIDEEWKSIPDFPGYEASSLGRIRSFRTSSMRGNGMSDAPRIMRQVTRKADGRPCVTLVRSDGVKKQHSTHHWIARAFLGPKPEGQVVRHLNDVKTDNRISNLRYGTHAENSADAIRNGLMARGDNHPSSKITQRDVEVMRSAHERGVTASILSLVFNIGNTQVHRILKGESWVEPNDEV